MLLIARDFWHRLLSDFSFSSLALWTQTEIPLRFLLKILCFGVFYVNGPQNVDMVLRISYFRKNSLKTCSEFVFLRLNFACY